MVRIVGPVAHVVWERPLPRPQSRLLTRPPPARDVPQELLVDLDLPDGAVPLGWDLGRGARRSPLEVVEATQAAYGRMRAERLPVRAAASAPVPPDAGAELRLRALVPPQGPPLTVRLAYVAPLSCREGRLVLELPASAEVDPLPMDVRVEARWGRGRARLRGPMTGQPSGPAPLRARFEAPRRAGFTLELEAPPRAEVAGLTTVAARDADGAVAVAACRAPVPSGARLRVPSRLVLVVDGSRSVGPTGLALERTLARALLERAGAATRFGLIVFSAAARPLHPLLRLVTDEALTSLDDALVPSLLANGSDVVSGLEAAGRLLAADRDSDAAEGQAAKVDDALVVLLTDGAVLDDPSLPPHVPPTLVGRGAAIASVVVREPGDEPPDSLARTRLRALVRRTGGLDRTWDGMGAERAAAELLSSWAAGGDWLDLALTPPRSASARSLAPRPLPGSLAPGQGHTAVLAAGTLEPGPGVSLAGWIGGREVLVPFVPSLVPRGWLGPLREGAAPSRVQGLVRDDVGVLVERVNVEPPAEPSPVRGDLDRQVVRNALSLAYLPRARACYLNRRVTSAADRDLRGRVRLALAFERGEVTGVTVEGRGLGRPELEECLRRAALELEMPRPTRRNAPSVALLNLVFQPHAAAPDAGPRDRTRDRTRDRAIDVEVDILLGPTGDRLDPRDLLRDAPAPARPGGAPAL